MPPYGRLLEFKRSKLKFSKCLGLSPAISAQFTFKMCAANGNRKKFTINPLFWEFKVIQGHRRWHQ